MPKLSLTIATTDYDHFRDFRTGEVRAEGIDHNWLTLGHHECFARFTANREFDLSELSFAKFAAQVTRENADIIGLPVVCSRLFRFSSFYVNKKSGIRSIQDLKRKKVGSPEWAHSAAVYMRGWMHNEPGVKLTRVADQSLSQLLAAGEIDCAIIARPPTCFLEGHPDVERLFPGYLEMEEEYYQRTRVWPIMHIIAMKKSILEEHPWAARNLYNAFQESKRRSIERLLDPAVSRYPLAWLATYARRMRDRFGGDPFPYGIEANRPTWEQMALYTHQQGIAHRRFTPEEIFPRSVETRVVI